MKSIKLNVDFSKILGVVCASTLYAISIQAAVPIKPAQKPSIASQSKATSSRVSGNTQSRSQSSGLPYYANDVVDLSYADCNPERPVLSDSEMLAALDGLPFPFSVPCNGEVCLESDTLSPEQSLRIRYLWSRMGINAFNGGYENSRPFSTDELNMIIRTFSLFPETLLNKIRGTTLVHKTTREAHIPIGIDQYQTFSPRAWTDSDNVIYIHTRFDELSFRLKVFTLFHELGHVVANALKIPEVSSSGVERQVDLDLSQAWLDAAGWLDFETIERPHIVASGYAKSRYGSSGEDFAESFLRYRLGAPAFLAYLGRSTEKYAFLRDHVFDGQEFLTKKDCR